MQISLSTTPQTLLDVTKMHQLGWTQKTSLREGIQTTYHFAEEMLNNLMVQD